MTPLNLFRVQGEALDEVVFFRAWKNFTLWVKHEYPGAPWEWILTEEKIPVAAGDELDQETAELRLGEAVKEFCPDFFISPEPEKTGLLGRLWRAL